MAKKTLKGWEKSDLDLDKYISEPCEIDESLYMYITECVPAQYSDTGLIQGGDCQKHDENEDFELIGYYMTASMINGKFFYLGILPEFKQ